MRVLDLFCGLKGWSMPFVERGHEAITLDVEARFEPTVCADVLAIDLDQLGGPFDVILASPPCEGFTVMNIGKNWTRPNDVPPHAPKTPLAWQALKLVARTREIIGYFAPAFFVIENPRAKLRKLPIMADLERRTVTYCHYGETNMKPTDLWGGFPPSLVLEPPCKNGDTCHVSAPRGSRTPGSIQGKKGSAERAIIPHALALAICLAAERDLGTRAVAEPPQGVLFG